jgi:formylmethanofuran dehydrogenase subunit C
MVVISKKQESGPEAGLAASKRFGRYKKETGKAVRETEIQGDEVLSRMRDALVGMRVEMTFELKEDDGYIYASSAVKGMGMEYSAEDVERFSLTLTGLEHGEEGGRWAGMFLSALMNLGQEDSYRVHTTHLDVELEYLGYRNRKSIVVAGNGGHHLGERMSGGEINVTANVGESAGGSLTGGRLVVEGNAGEYLGNDMADGEILVRGNAGRHAGNIMRSGTITVLKRALNEAGSDMIGGSLRIGSTGNKLGSGMEGGSILVEGNAGSRVGLGMQGGEIHIKGRVKSISDPRFGGNVYVGDKVYPGEADTGYNEEV